MKLAGTFLAFSLLAGAFLQPALAEDAQYQTGDIPDPVISVPTGEPKAMVVLLSDKDGWNDKMQTEANRLTANGAVVVGIDTPKYIASAQKTFRAQTDDDCIYLVSDIEELSHEIQRRLGGSAYIAPLISGVGQGGTLALAILAQTPNATLGETLAVDPGDVIPIPDLLCTPAEKTNKDGGVVYGITDGALPDPTTIVFTPAATQEGRDHVAAIVKADHPDIEVSDSNNDAYKTLSDNIDAIIAANAKEAQPLGLPLTLLEVDKPALDTVAVIYSGDGGWRDIDSDIATYFQQQGIPVVGVDSLRYFWSQRKPQETADDLNRIINTFTKRWKVKHVMLVGFSFGADVSPKIYNLLPQSAKQKINQVSLLSMSHQSDFEISVTGWLGAKGSGTEGDPTKEVAQMPSGLVQCLYGADDIEDDGCHDLDPKKVDILKLEGGHHFDGDYEAVAKIILDRLKTKQVD